MKTVTQILICFLWPLVLFGQEKTIPRTKKVVWNIQTGIHYKTFLSNKYIQPTPKAYFEDFNTHQYERYTQGSTFGFRLGLRIDYELNERWAVSTGLVYVNRKDVFESDKDTIIKYGKPSSMKNIYNVLKYKYIYYDFQIPLLIGYSKGKIVVQAGANISIFTYRKAKYTYLVNIHQYPEEPLWGNVDKTVFNLDISLKVFPSVQTSYQIKIKTLILNPYLAFYYEINHRDDFFIDAGVVIPLTR